MKRSSWFFILGASLITLSALFYYVHYLIFHDPHHIFIFLVGDIAFVPVEVLLVTLILHRLLSERAKRSMIKKLNMVIGAFFSEVGNTMLVQYARVAVDSGEFEQICSEPGNFSEKGMRTFCERFEKKGIDVKLEVADFEELKVFLVGKRGFMLRLLENPNLLEHERFTELLWAVFHLVEELEHREDLTNLPKTDLAHLEGDVLRVYRSLLAEYLFYLNHLKDDYPYLFSLAMRLNPFSPNASPVVR